MSPVVTTAAGCQLVATCDLAVAGTAAKFCTPGVDIGLFCSTPMVALTRAVAPKRAMEMLLLGDMIDAETAATWSLVNRVVPAENLLDAARALAGDMLSCVPEMLLRYKSIIDDGFALPFGEGMALEQARSREFNAGVGAAAVEARREAVRARNRGD